MSYEVKEHIESDGEFWVEIDEFPSYSVSNTGLVLNEKTNRLLSQSQTKDGAMKVGLVGHDGKQYTRSVKVLVARAWVDGEDDIANTPINLDGDPTNNHARNLVWRPRWYAWKYTHQFSLVYSYYLARPIMEDKYGEVSSNIQEAAMRYGLLMKDVWESCVKGVPVYPHWQTFSFLDE